MVNFHKNMIMNPIVSIIAPTYNHEKLISSCIDSILTQTFYEWELILIDDCSSDRTNEIIQSYLLRDIRIKLIKHETRWGAIRLVETYNQALSLSKGKYIAIIEGDDYWPANKLACQIEIMENNKDVVLSYGLIATDTNGKINVKKIPWAKDVLTNKPFGKILIPYLFGKNEILSQSVMVKKDVLLEIGGFQTKEYSLFLIDYPTWMEIALKGEFRFIPSILGYWRRHPSQITQNNTEMMYLDQIKFIKYFIEHNKNELNSLKILPKDLLEKPGWFIYFDLCRFALLTGNKRKALSYLIRLIKAECSFLILVRMFSSILLLSFRFIFRNKD